MRNIVFYIHRTGLLGYFLNPICQFLKSRYRITVLNINQRNGYTSTECDLYDMIDISTYSVSEIRSLLVQLSPQAVILLGYVSIFELLMLRIATDLGLKTIFLEHGIYSKETSSLPLKKLLTQFRFTVSKNFFFLGKYRAFTRASKNPAQERRIFRQCLLKKDYSCSRFSKALFFAEYGYKRIDSLFNYSKDDVDFIGYPLARDNREFEEYQALALAPLPICKKAILIHQPFILDGLVKWSYDDEKKYYKEVADEIAKHGYSLTLLVHPRENLERYEELYKGSGIAIKQNFDRKNYKDYSLALGHYSTALLYPIFFGVPIRIIDYGDTIKAEDSTFFPLNCRLPLSDDEGWKRKYESFRNEFIGNGNCSFENIAMVLDKSIQA